MAQKTVTPVVDYDAARAQAIRWLGDRYLLAKPINRRFQGWQAGHERVTDDGQSRIGNPQVVDLKAG